MKRAIFFLSLFLIIPFHSSFSIFRPVRGLESSNIKRVIVSPFDSEAICVASDNSLYKSWDGGEEFKKAVVFKDEEVQHIFFDSSLSDIIYIVTDRHFYILGEEMKRLYSSPDDEKIFTAAQHKGMFYLGTSSGLRFAAEDNLIWRNIKSFNDFAIYFMDPAGDNLYLATEKGAYILKDGKEIEKLFAMRKEEESGEEGLSSRIIKADIANGDLLWLGTNQGLFVSEDSGANWRKLYLPGIGNISVNCLAQTKLQNNSIYLGAAKGFFLIDLDRNSSKQLFEGLYSSYISWAEFTPEGRIYLATPKGLFENDYFSSAGGQDNLGVFLAEGPSVGEIQEAALLYNEVHPDKIRRWRRGLKYRALFPVVSLDYDKTISVSTNPNYKETVVGPNDWGVSFSWDIGDLVWNTYEDDVDTRARLNTQLRLDILDEINRVYFERVRLRRELSNVGLTDEELFKKRLRLAELTAIIDGYTGGYFSKQMGENSAQP